MQPKVLVEGLVAGKSVIGCDVSPLALFAAAHHTDAQDLDVEAFAEIRRR